jgi:hypothetical protein
MMSRVERRFQRCMVPRGKGPRATLARPEAASGELADRAGHLRSRQSPAGLRGPPAREPIAADAPSAADAPDALPAGNRSGRLMNVDASGRELRRRFSGRPEFREKRPSIRGHNLTRAREVVRRATASGRERRRGERCRR